MKLIVQIALGVFIGTLAGQLAVDAWRSHREDLAKLAAVRQRTETEERVRALFLQNRPGMPPAAPGFVPDDAGK